VISDIRREGVRGARVRETEDRWKEELSARMVSDYQHVVTTGVLYLSTKIGSDLEVIGGAGVRAWRKTRT